MGSSQSSCMKVAAVNLAPTSSSDVGSNDNDSDMWELCHANHITDDNISEDCSDEDDEDEEAVEERLRILEESRKLRMMAEFFAHPEKPVKVNPAAFGRCYFERNSAPQQTSQEESEEAANIIEEVMSLKKVAVDYRHPELPVESDASACARCYFERASAPQQEEDEEKTRILAEMSLLKKAAYDYLHPEAPVNTSDPTVFGRNYFTRYSAPEQLSEEEEAERELILKEAKALKLSTVARKAPVETDPTAFGRNYFTRPSGPEQTTAEEEEELTLILKDVKALHKLAIDYQHPELPVETNPTAFGRNYFTRPSAPEQVDEEERQAVLADAKALYKLAIDYQHPELPVETNPTAFGRNYFNRPSAPLPIALEEEEEHEQVEHDLKQLKKLAIDFHHPEFPVQDYYHHHAHFDMDDDIHLHHLEFDRNTDHHNEISEAQFTTPSTNKAIIDHDDIDLMLSMSPGCVMTFAQP